MSFMWKMGGLWLAVVAVAFGELAEKPHPRLWFPRSAEAGLREKIATDPLAAKLHEAVMAEAAAVLKARVCRYEIPDGKRLLAESRLALHNILHSAWAWRLGGGEQYRLRAIAELEAACGLKDWNTSHFLDTAEMATAVAVGYDWLHDTLSPEQRAMCEKAIVEKALKPAMPLYEKKHWWAQPRNNWAQVCGAGIALAAAAIAGHDEGMAESLFSSGLDLVEQCNVFYLPDGMYPEGPGYWHYGTNYHVMMLAACAPLGRAMPDSPELRKAGDAIMHLTSTTGLTYSFADGNPGQAVPTPAQSWIAGHFKDAVQSRHVRDLFTRRLEEDRRRIGKDRFFPLNILWLPPAPSPETPVSNAAVFRGEQSMALFRTGWEKSAPWLAIKGGTPAASHGHMDVGSFVYDAHGTRWLHDLGSENYNLPAYFGNRRWDYFRLQNRAHNTLEIGGQLQNPKAAPCPLTDSSLTGDPLTATFDLSDAYSNSAKKVIRSASFDRATGRTVIQDEISGPAGEVVWRAITDAKAEIQGDRVILKKQGSRITLRRLSESGTWSIASAKPPTAEENQNAGKRVIALTVPQAGKVSIQVEIKP